MCKAKTACDQLQQGSRDVRVLETETEVLCVLLCAPARVINNCDKFFFPPPLLHVKVLDCASCLNSPSSLSHALELPRCMMIDGTMQQMTAG